MPTDPSGEPKQLAPLPPSKVPSPPTPWSGIGKLSTLGLEVGLTVAGLSVLGWWLDSKWDTSPWLTLAGATIGIIGTTYKLLKVSASMDDKKPGAK